MALPGESVSKSWDRFTTFLRSVPNHRIDDDDPNKNILALIDVHGQLLPDVLGEHQQRG